jgi:hypothetical protein
MPDLGPPPSAPAGIPVDAHGNPTIDPTKNVLDLVRAESLRQDGLRKAGEDFQAYRVDAESKFQNFARDAEARLQTLVRNSETQRLDQLAVLRQSYEARIADMLAVSVKSTSDLVSTQLVQIQATFNDRVSKLEQFRWESGGADRGTRDRDVDRRGNVGMIIGIASFCALAISMIVGAVMFVIVDKTPVATAAAPTLVAPAIVPLTPK